MTRSIDFVRQCLLSTAAGVGLLGCMALILLATKADAASLYKWKDESGTVHFSERPPAEEDFEKVSSRYSASQPATSHQSAPATPAVAQPAAATPPAEISQEEDLKRQLVSQERCDKARKNMEAFNSFARIRIRDENGEFRFLSEEEISSRKMETKTILQDECAP